MLNVFKNVFKVQVQHSLFLSFSKTDLIRFILSKVRNQTFAFVKRVTLGDRENFKNLDQSDLSHSILWKTYRQALYINICKEMLMFISWDMFNGEKKCESGGRDLHASYFKSRLTFRYFAKLLLLLQPDTMNAQKPCTHHNMLKNRSSS